MGRDDPWYDPGYQTGMRMAEPPMRPLSDKVLTAFNQACDIGDAEIAECCCAPANGP